MDVNKDFTYAPNAHKAKDWQKAIVEEMVLFDQLCKDNDIEYFVFGGGLLGTVRHRGFIPWDNDVDVCMTEPNYNKLLKVYKEGKFPEGHALVDRNTESTYPLLFGRFVNTNTSCPLSTSSFNGGKHGIFLDVFIMFAVPDDEAQQREAIEYMLVWEELLCYLKRRCIVRSDGFIEKWKAAKEFEKKNGHDAALADVEAKFRSYMPENPNYYVFGSSGVKDGYPVTKAEWYKESVRLPFENIEVEAPVGYLEMLQTHYGGSWREMPEGEEFKAYAGADLCIPSEVVREDYMQFIDAEQCDKDFRTWKDLSMEEMILENAYVRRKTRVLSECVGWKCDTGSVKPDITDNYRDLGTLLTADAEELVNRRNRTYTFILNQMRPEFKKWEAPLHMDPESVVTAAWAYLLTREDFWVPKKFIEISHGFVKMQKYWEQEPLQAFLTAEQLVEKLFLAIDHKDNAAVQECIDGLTDYNAASLPEAIGKAFLVSQEDPTACIEFIDSLCKEYRVCSHYLRFYKGACLLECGKVEEGIDELSELNALTCNGILKLAIADLAAEKGFELKEVEVERPKVLTSAEAPRDENDKVIQPETGLHYRPYYSDSISDYSWRADLAKVKAGNRRMGKLALARKKVVKQRQEAEEKVREYRAVRRVTDARIIAWNKVAPRKQAILDAAAKGNVEEAFKLCKPLVNAAHRLYKKRQLGVTIDKEILEAIKPQLKKEWGDEFYEGYLAAIPEQHASEDFSDMLKRKGVKHPYLED